MNFLSKFFLLVMVLSTAASLFAGPPPRGRGPNGKGWERRGGESHRNDGVRLAADIVNLVGASINILRPQPTVVMPAQPIVPAYYVQPSPPPVIVQQPYVTPAPVVVSPRVYVEPPRMFAPPPPPAGPYRPSVPRHGGYRPGPPPRR